MSDRTISRRDFLHGTGVWALRLGVAGVAGAGYTRTVEPAWIDIHPVALTLPRLAAPFHGYRLVQISDIHMGDWMTRARLDEVVAAVNAQAPDLIAITGDFATHPAPDLAPDLIAPLGRLRARDGVVAVLGNHDYVRGAATVIRQVLQASGIANLDNRAVTRARQGALLHIAGVDDIWHQQDRLDTVLARLPRAGAAILLAHEPDFADTTAASGRFDLQLSGHSHGGQVVIPFVRPTQLPPLGRKYYSGRYQVGTLIQYTNRGVGMVPPHVRFNCRPEITVFTLHSPAAGG